MPTFDFTWEISTDNERRRRKTGLSHTGYLLRALALYRVALDEAFAGGAVTIGNRRLSDAWFGPDGAKVAAAARTKSAEDSARNKIATMGAVISAAL